VKTDWPVVPIWSVATEIRRIIEPGESTGDFFHYSIPVVDKTGTGRVESAADVGSAKLLLDGGEVLISKLNPRKGRVLITQRNELPVVASPEFIALQPSSVIVDRFFAYLLSSETARLHLDANVQSVTRSHQRVTPELVKHFKFPLPSIDEQRRIADFLDAETAFIDRVEILRARQMEHLGQRRWSVLQNTIDGTPADMLPLRRLLHAVTDGPFGSAFSSSDYVDEGAAVIRLGNIGFGEYRPQEQARIPMELYSELRKHEVLAGDILIAGLGDPRNHAGRACIAPDLGPAIVKGKCFRARVDAERSSAEFLTLLLSSPIGAAALEGRGSTRSMINLEIVKSAILPIPRYTDQVAIAAEMSQYWKTAIAAIQACDRQLALLAERRQALITAAVTGRISV
jgi:type I restriction enzyme, S subunit